MNLMTWLTGKTLAELVKKGQLIPPEIKLPVYPASHYKKNWYEQGIPHGGVIGLTAIMMTMTWIVSINMVIAQFELHNKKASGAGLLPGRGLYRFSYPVKSAPA